MAAAYSSDRVPVPGIEIGHGDAICYCERKCLHERAARAAIDPLESA
jgi:hypothetical protein